MNYEEKVNGDGFIYWQNKDTDEIIWENPNYQTGSEQNQFDSQTYEYVSENNEWVLYYDEEGNGYWYNETTGESEWAEPEAEETTGNDDDDDDESDDESDDEMNEQQRIERSALEDLYAATMGDTCWENIDGWDEGSDEVGEWWGVTLSKHEAEEYPGIDVESLVRIRLVKNGLAGQIPTSINTCKYLIILNLYFNLIEGPIPDLGKLKNLIKLDLSRNRLTGPIHPSISKLNKLEKLQIQNNLLTGICPVELCSLTALKFFDISRNDLVGMVPEDIGYMEPLMCLCLNDNRFTGIIPETMTLLTNLEKLTVQFNKFEVDPHWLLEYIPEECEFEADEEEICRLEFWKPKPKQTMDDQVEEDN